MGGVAGLLRLGECAFVFRAGRAPGRDRRLGGVYDPVCECHDLVNTFLMP